MADNVSVTAGSGTSIATDLISGVHYQRMKLTFGVDGAATDVSAADPLPVDVGTVPVTGTFWQATQPISGTVAVSGSVAVTGSFYQATQPVSIAGTVAVSGPLTDTQLRATPVPVSGTFYQATQPVSIATMPSTPVTGTFWQATQPVSGTFWQTTQPVSIATAPVLVAGSAIIGKVGIDQTTPGTTNKVSIGTDGSVTLAAGTAGIGKLTANAGVTIGAVELAASQTLATVTNLAQLGGQAVAMGTGVRSAGTQRVTIATDDVVPCSQSGTWNVGSITTLPALVAGTALVGKVGLDQTTPGTTNATSLAQVGSTTVATGNGVVGTGVQRVAIASDNTAFSVNATGPTLTKATQGSTGFSTQDLKDAGRVSFAAATVIGGVTAVSTEALLTMVPVRAGTASGTATTQAVTANKRLRVQAIVASVRSTGATVISARVALRMNPSGAVTASSPILAILSMTQQAAALAEAGDTCVFQVPDGLEFSGTEQIGLTQVCSGTAGVVYASIVGYEY